MTYDDIQDEVINARFKETQRTSVRHWINQRYAWIWAAGDWHFKKVFNEALEVSAADTTPTMPGGYNRTLRLYDDLGTALMYLSPEEFSTSFSDLTTTGRPSFYTVVNRELQLAPIPDTSYTFKHSYERTVCHLADGSTVTTGLMNSDNDTPVWPSEHHFILVIGAIATGLKIENDPTYLALEEEFNAAYMAMKDDLLPPDRGQNLQYGRDTLGYEGL
jgi:hypothetical protein